MPESDAFVLAAVASHNHSPLRPPFVYAGDGLSDDRQHVEALTDRRRSALGGEVRGVGAVADAAPAFINAQPNAALDAACVANVIAVVVVIHWPLPLILTRRLDGSDVGFLFGIFWRDWNCSVMRSGVAFASQMPPAKSVRVKVGIDLPALLKMSEPLTIHVTRVRGSQKETIPLDVREGHTASGVGWSIDDVKAIDQEIIDVSGGGVYEVQVTDASADPQSTSWSFVIPPEVYPVKPPRTLAPIYTYGAGPAPYAPPQPQYGAPQPQYAAPQPSPLGYLPPYQPPQPAVTPRPGGDPALAATMAAQHQHQQLTAELHRRDLAAIEDRHRHEREMAEIKRQQAEAAAAAARPQHDERYERERAAREAAERDAVEARRLAAETTARLDREAAERRAEAAAQALRAEMVEDRRRADDKFNQLMAQMAALAQRPSGPDPVLQMMMENQRTTAEAAREAARINAETEREKARLAAEADKEVARARADEARLASEAQQRLITTVQSMMAPNQMSPMDAARVVREASQGADQFTRTIVGSMNDMMDIQRNFLSNMMQMAPQGEGVAGRVVSAIENVAQTFTQSQAQVAAAQANAAATVARGAQGPMPGWQPPPPVAPTGAAAPQPPADVGGTAPSGGLNGPPATAEPAQPAPIADASSAAAPITRNGKTDEEWFGPALPDVMRLREGVMKYLTATMSEEATLDQPKGEPITVVDETTGKPIGVSPVTCAKIIIMAATEVSNKNIPGVQAFDYFWKQQMYPALVDVMVPDAPAAYRVDALRFLNRMFIGEPLFKDNDAPMFGIEKYLSDDDSEDAGEAPASSNGNGTSMPMPVAPAREPMRVTGGRPRQR